MVLSPFKTIQGMPVCYSIALTQIVKEGDAIVEGGAYGRVLENSLIVHRLLLPPTEKGTIKFIAGAGNYSLKVCE